MREGEDLVSTIFGKSNNNYNVMTITTEEKQELVNCFELLKNKDYKIFNINKKEIINVEDLISQASGIYDVYKSVDDLLLQGIETQSDVNKCIEYLENHSFMVEGFSLYLSYYNTEQLPLTYIPSTSSVTDDQLQSTYCDSYSILDEQLIIPKAFAGIVFAVFTLQ